MIDNGNVIETLGGNIFADPNPRMAGMELSRIILVNWYAFSKIDIEVRGNIALIGSNGVGKSSIIDAIQLILSGNNRRYFKTNASADVSTKESGNSSPRSVVEYCTGCVNGEVLRPESVSYVALVFKDRSKDHYVTAGMCFHAREGETKETELGSFVADSFNLTSDDFVSNNAPRDYQEFERLLLGAKGGTKVFSKRNKSADFVRFLYERIVFDNAFSPETYLKSLKNSLSFKGMEDPTMFVRKFVIPAPILEKGKVDKLKESYSHWQTIEGKAQNVGRQLASISTISDRYEKLLERKRDLSKWSLVEVLANCHIAREIENNAASAVSKASEELDKAREQLSYTRDNIKTLENQITLAKSELSAEKIYSDLNLKNNALNQIVKDRDYTSGQRVRLLSNLLKVLSLRPSLEEHAVALSARKEIDALAAFASAADSDYPIVKSVEALKEALSGLSQKAADHETLLQNMAAEIRHNMREDSELLKLFNSTGRLLSPKVSALIAELDAAGIKSQPLCSLVEVVDERWRDALETLLGNAREALIVHPDQVLDAIAIVENAGSKYSGCLIYDAKDYDVSTPAPHADSLASKLRTNDFYARAFISIRIGNITCVETREQLRFTKRGVTPAVMVKSGGAIYKANPYSHKLLGMTVIQGSANEIENRITLANQKISGLSKNVADLRRISSGVEEFLTNSDDSGKISEFDAEIIRLEREKDAISAEINTLHNLLNSDAFSGLKELEQDLKAYTEQLQSDDENVATLAAALGKVNARLETASEKARDASEKLEERSALYSSETLSLAESEFSRLLGDLGSAINVSNKARMEIEAGGGKLEHRIQAIRQDAANYARDFNEEFSADDTEEGLSQWIEHQVKTLSGDVLLKYQQEALEARLEMEKCIYNDFILRLASDLQEGHRKVEQLNKTLRRHSFNGERFEFTVSEHKDYADIVALSKAVVASERKISDLFDSELDRVDDLSDREASGMNKIRKIFEGGGDVDHFIDYRNYLVFDLVSFDVKTNKRRSGSKERSKRSGGERQVPFYIAMASATASICLTGKKNGMGLSIFDEAFNLLDNSNTSSIVSMMNQLGLQFLLSGPSDKAPAFVAHSDTVVNMSRVGTYCQIDVEYPTKQGKEEMLKRNPSISGISALEYMN